MLKELLLVIFYQESKARSSPFVKFVLTVIELGLLGLGIAIAWKLGWLQAVFGDMLPDVFGATWEALKAIVHIVI